MAMRDVPLRTRACRHSDRETADPGKHCPRPGSRKRLTPRITASSSAWHRPTRSLARHPVRSRATAETESGSQTAMTTTRRPRRFCHGTSARRPATPPSVLDDVLADFRQRHREAMVSSDRCSAPSRGSPALLLHTATTHERPRCRSPADLEAHARLAGRPVRGTERAARKVLRELEEACEPVRARLVSVGDVNPDGRRASAPG